MNKITNVFFTLLILVATVSVQAEETVLFTIYLDKNKIGEINIDIPVTDNPFLNKTELSSVLEPILKPSIYERFEQTNANPGKISLNDLKRLGISSELKEPELSLELIVPMDMRKITDLSLVGRRYQLGIFRSIDPYAGYLNADILAGVTQNQNSNGSNSDPLEGQLNLVQNLNGAVLESSSYYQEFKKNPWEMGSTSIVKDFESKSTRLRIGDNNPLSIGFMNGINAAGLTYSKEASISPDKPTSVTRTALIEMKSPGTIEISIDNVLIARTRLNPGPFNLRDLPLLSGRNKVHVKIIDDFGGIEEFDVDLFFDGQILAKGRSEFSYFYGNPVQIEDRIREYQSEGFTSALYRFGLSDQLTVGSNFQSYSNRYQLGLETGYLNQYGTWKYDLAYADHENDYSGIKGFADRFRFYSHEQKIYSIKGFRTTFDYEHRTSKYSGITTGSPQFSDYSSRAEASITKGIKEKWNIRFGGGYVWNNFEKSDQRLYRAGLQGVVVKNAALDINYSRLVGVTSEDQFFVNLTWTEPSGQSTASTFYESLGKSTTANYTQNRLAGDTNNSSLTIQESPDNDRVNFRVGHYASKAEVYLNHDTQKRRLDSEHNTQLGLGSALAWTSQSVSLTRPVTDAFAIVQVQNLPKDEKIILQPSGGLPETVISENQSLTLPQISSYSAGSVNFDSTLLSQGIQIERESYTFNTKYKSGLVIPIRVAKNILVIGKIVDQEGRPVEFLGGQVVNSEDVIVTESFFTNSDGQFILDQVPPGKYQVKISDKSYSAFNLEIPESTETKIQIPEIKIQKRNIQP